MCEHSVRFRTGHYAHYERFDAVTLCSPISCGLQGESAHGDWNVLYKFLKTKHREMRLNVAKDSHMVAGGSHSFIMPLRQ